MLGHGPSATDGNQRKMQQFTPLKGLDQPVTAHTQLTKQFMVVIAVRRQTRHSQQTGVKNQTGEKLVLGSVVCVALEAQVYPLRGENLRINWEVTHIMNAR